MKYKNIIWTLIFACEPDSGIDPIDNYDYFFEIKYNGDTYSAGGNISDCDYSFSQLLIGGSPWVSSTNLPFAYYTNSYLIVVLPPLDKFSNTFISVLRINISYYICDCYIKLIENYIKNYQYEY